MYKVFEPRKLATPKNICIEILKKSKKIEEENKMVEETQAQSTPMFVDPSMLAPEAPAEQAPVVEAPQAPTPVETSQNAFNMAPPVAESVTPVEPVAEAPVAETPVQVEPVAAAPVQEAPVAQPVEQQPTFISTPTQPVEQVVTAPQPVEQPQFVETPTVPVAETPVQVEPVAVAPVQEVPVAAPVAEVPASPVEPTPVVEQTVVQPVPVATTTELNPQAKEAFDTLLNIYNNDKNKIIEDFNNYNPQMINTSAPVEINNIDLNNIPVVQQEVQTEPLGEDRVFTGNTGPIPVVNPEMVNVPMNNVQPVEAAPVMEQPIVQPESVQAAPVAEVPVMPEATPVEAQPTFTPITDTTQVQQEPVAAPVAEVPVAPVEQPLAPVAPVVETPVVGQPAVEAPQEVQVPMNNMVPPMEENAQAPQIAPLGSDEVPNIDLTTISNEQDLGMKLPDTPVEMPEGQVNKVVGFGLMDGQPNNNQGVGLSA